MNTVVGPAGEFTTELGRQFADETRLVAIELAGETLLVVQHDLDEFLAGFRWLKRGNYWRLFRDLSITVFRTDSGYGWSIASPGGKVRDSRRKHGSEQDAPTRAGKRTRNWARVTMQCHCRQAEPMTTAQTIS